jgi:hypothetical protein
MYVVVVNMEEIKIGVRRLNSDYRWWKQYDYICGCGKVEGHVRDSLSYICKKCGNANFINVRKNQKNAIASTQLECLNKGLKFFHLRKKEIDITIDQEKCSLSFKEGSILELVYDLSKRVIEITINNKKVDSNKKNITRFFRRVSMEDFLKVATIEENNAFFRFVCNYLCESNNDYYNIGEALLVCFEKPVYELFYFSGFNNLLRSIYIHKQFSVSNKTKPHEILGVPKIVMPYLKKVNSIYPERIEKINYLYNLIGGNNLRNMLQIFVEESSLDNLFLSYDNIIELYEEHQYKDLTKLSLYITREVKLQQGITSPSEASRYLLDYIKMSKRMGHKHEKYPKSLKKVHDIALMNYKTIEDENKKESFIKVVSSDDYKRLVYKGENYSIVSPKTPTDLILEGDALSHCVASYVDDVINNRCKIYFMRKNDSLEQSLMTIDLRDNKYIRQFRGFANRKPTREEELFLYEWASKMDLEIQSY